MIARCGNCHCTIKDGDKVYYILDIGDAYDKVYIRLVKCMVYI